MGYNIAAGRTVDDMHYKPKRVSGLLCVRLLGQFTLQRISFDTDPGAQLGILRAEGQSTKKGILKLAKEDKAF